MLELSRNLCMEATIHNADSIVAFLLGADTDATIAGDAQVVVTQQEGVLVVKPAVTRLSALEASTVGVVTLDQDRQLLRGDAAQRADCQLTIFGGDHLQQCFTELLDPFAVGLNLHVVCCHCGTGSHRVLAAFHLHHTEATGAKGLQTWIITERRDEFPVALRNLVDGFTWRKGDQFAIQGERWGSSFYGQKVYPFQQFKFMLQQAFQSATRQSEPSLPKKVSRLKPTEWS